MGHGLLQNIIYSDAGTVPPRFARGNGSRLGVSGPRIQPRSPVLFHFCNTIAIIQQKEWAPIASGNCEYTPGLLAALRKKISSGTFPLLACRLLNLFVSDKLWYDRNYSEEGVPNYEQDCSCRPVPSLRPGQSPLAVQRRFPHRPGAAYAHALPPAADLQRLPHAQLHPRRLPLPRDSRGCIHP